MIFSVAFLCFGNHYVTIFSALFLIGNGIAITSTSVTAAVAHHAPTKNRAQILGMASSLRFLTNAFVGMGGGALASISPQSPLYASIVVNIIFAYIVTKAEFLRWSHATDA